MADSPTFDVAGARAAGYSDQEIADYLGSGSGFNVAGAVKAGYSYADIIDHLAPAPAAPAPEKQSEPPSGTLKGVGKAVGQEAMKTVGEYVAGKGQEIASAGQALGKGYQEDLQRQIDIMKRIDDGAAPGDFKDMPDLDRLFARQYQISSPERRANMRQEVLNTIAGSQIEPSFAERVPGAMEKVGGQIAEGGRSVEKSAERTFPLTDEEQGRTSVMAARMVTGLGAYIGAGALGGLPGVVDLASTQAFGQTFDEAKSKGASDEDAAKAALANGLIQGTMMTVPVGRAMAVLDKVPAALRGKFVEAAIEMGKSSATMVGFTQLSQLADNVVAQNTYDPNRKLTERLGQNLIPTAVAGAFAPLAVAGVEAGARRIARRLTPAPTPEADANKVMQADTVDQAIDTAQQAIAAPVDVGTEAAGLKEFGGETEQQQGKLLQLFGGLNAGVVERTEDGVYQYRPADNDTAVPLKVWDPATAKSTGEDAAPTISPQLAAAQRAHYRQLGVDVVYFENDPRIPFDGAVDPQNPNTIFLSNDPSRNAAQVGAHELTHVLESTKLPDGTNLGDVLHQQIAAGLTPEGLAHAQERFGATAPERTAFPEGPEGDSAHADAVMGHLIRELGADIGGEAPKFNTFLPRVVDEVQQRYGLAAAKDVVGKLIAGIQQAMRTLRAFFSRPEELAEYGQPETVSQNWVTNLDAIHQTLAKMYAERYGTEAEKQDAALAAARDRTQREAFIQKGFAAFEDAVQRAQPTEEATPLTEQPERLTPEARRLTPPEQQPAVDTALQRVATLRRWLGELDQQRRDAAQTSPQATLLRQTEAAILGKVNGVEGRLTGAAATRLERVRGQLDDVLNPTTDTPDMARIREALGHEQERLARAAEARRPERPAARPAEPPPVEAAPVAPTAPTGPPRTVAQMLREVGPEVGRAIDEARIPADALPQIAGFYRPESGEDHAAAFDRAVNQWIAGQEAKGTGRDGAVAPTESASGTTAREIPLRPGSPEAGGQSGSRGELAGTAVPGEETRQAAAPAGEAGIRPQEPAAAVTPVEGPQFSPRIEGRSLDDAAHAPEANENDRLHWLPKHQWRMANTHDQVAKAYDARAAQTQAFANSIIARRGITRSAQGYLDIAEGYRKRAAEARDRRDEYLSRMRGEGPQFSPRLTGENPDRAYTPEQRQAFENAGFVVEPRTLADHWQKFTEGDLRKKLLRETLDPYVGVKEHDPEGYMALRLANSSNGAVEQFMKVGTLKFNGHAYDVDQANGGVEHALIRPLGNEAGDFIKWVAGNRAERLKAEDRENLLSSSDIVALKSLNRGTLGFDYALPNGHLTRSREAAYADSLRKLDTFNRNAMDLAVDAGLLKRDDVNALWSNPFYVPFYRQAEGDNRFVGPRASAQFVKQNAFKKLEGGAEKLHHDLWENAIGNWSHLIDASIRNKAGLFVLENAADPRIGAAEKLTAQQALHLSDKEQKATTQWAMQNGERQYYRITDPFLFRAVSSLNAGPIGGTLMNVGRWFKRILQVGTTLNPLFAVRSLIRDTEQVAAVSPLSFNLLGNLAQGFKMNDTAGTLVNIARAVAGRELEELDVSPETRSAIAGGGLMRLGAGTTGGFRDTTLSTMLDTPERLKGFQDYIGTIWHTYREFMGQHEDVNRLALYHQLREQGLPHDAATFAARDLMDFTLSGASPAVRAITSLVPFMNAWAQGLYKVGRAAADTDRNVAGAVGAKVLSGMTKRVAIVLAATTALTLALDGLYADDEDYKKRSEYDRNSFFWFKFGGTVFRVPMGFEIAALSRIASNGIEAMFGLSEMDGRRFLNNLWSIVGTNLSMNPIPQAAAPLVDLWTNTSATGHPITPMGMEGLQAQEQYTVNNSLAARALSAVLNTGARALFGQQAQSLSPIQIDYLVNAYGGWMATQTMFMADTVARSLASEPARPARDLWAVATQGMVQTEPTAASRYVDMLYQQGEGIQKAWNTYRDMLQRGQAAEAQQFYQDNRDALQKYGLVSGVMRSEAALGRQIRLITNNPDPRVTPEQKRIAIQQLQAIRNRAAEQAFGGQR